VIRIVRDDLTHPDVVALLLAHAANLASISPPESTHVLNLDGLRDPSVTLWSAWEGEDLVGVGALKELDPLHGEVKSMRTVEKHLRRGFAGLMLDHIVAEARTRGYARLSLETGSMIEFAPARAMYQRAGFEDCPPFGSYVPDENSVFLTLAL